MSAISLERPLAATQLLAPCEPTKIIAGGANYHGHLKEVNLPVPTVPVFFLKPPTSLIGPDQPVILQLLELPLEKAQVEERSRVSASEVPLGTHSDSK